MCVCVRVHVHVCLLSCLRHYFRGKHFQLENGPIQISSEEWSLRTLPVSLERVLRSDFLRSCEGGEGFAEEICPLQVLGHNKITYHPAQSKATLSANEEKSAVPAKC